MKFKIGDEVRIIKSPAHTPFKDGTTLVGIIGIIFKIEDGYYYLHPSTGSRYHEAHLELISIDAPEIDL